MCTKCIRRLAGFIARHTRTGEFAHLCRPCLMRAADHVTIGRLG